VIVALTADHGVAPYPGVRSSDPNAGAQRVTLTSRYEAARDALAQRGVPADAFTFVDGMIGVDRAVFDRAGVSADSVLRAFAAAVAPVPGVQRVDLWSDLAKADTSRDVIARRWLHMFTPEFAPTLVVTLDPYSVWGPATYAQHGSPHDYDTNVPVVFYGAPFRPARYTQVVRVVDIAPTLAAVLGVPPTEPLDGRVLREALRQPPAPSTPSAQR
jgi:arylsulfatase A-like enzyme